MECEYSPLAIDSTWLHKHFRSTLTQSQDEFVKVVLDWIERPCKMLVTLSGGPGTGKTHTVMQTFGQLNLDKGDCLKMAYTGRSAHAIGGRTIHSTLRLNYNSPVLKDLESVLEGEEDVRVVIAKGQAVVDLFLCADDPRIVIVDEVGMISGWLIYWLVRFFMDRTTRPLLFVAMGDRHQLTPVRSKQNMFGIADALAELYKVRSLVLTENNRFDPDYERIIHKLTRCVDRDDEEEMIALVKKYFPVVDDVTSKMMKKATRAMAFKNETVNLYNQEYIDYKVPGPLIKVYQIANDNSVVETKFQCVKKGCLIFVTQNGPDPRVSNGTQLIFRRYDPNRDVMVCELLKGAPHNKETTVSIHRVTSEGHKYEGLFPIELGFAGTVHKFQGQTMDDSKIVINFDGNRDLHLVYTALSRVRGMQQILAVKL